MAARHYVMDVASQMEKMTTVVGEAETSLETEGFLSGDPIDPHNRSAWVILHTSACRLRDRLNSLTAQLDHALNGPGDGPKEKY